MGTFILLCALASSTTTDPADSSSAPPAKTTPKLTPEQEVEAWDGDLVAPPTAREAVREAVTVHTNVVAVAVPIVSAVVGLGAGFATAVVVSRSNGLGAVIAGGLVGFVLFDGVLASGLALLLPPGFPSWTVPVTVAAVDVAAIGTATVATVAGAAYFFVVYNGGDCFCGPDIGIVPVVGAITVVTATVGASIVTVQLLRPDDIAGVDVSAVE